MKLSLGSSLAVTGINESYIAESLDYFALLPTAPSSTYKKKANARIKKLVDAGIWSKLDILYFFDMDTEANSLINVKGNASYNATVSGSINHNPKFGIKSIGGYLDSNFNPLANGVNYQKNSCSIGICNGDLGINSGYSFGCTDGIAAIQGIFTNAFFKFSN